MASGLVLLPRAIALFLLMPVAGWMLKIFDPRALVLLSVTILFVAYYKLGQLSLDINFWTLVPLLLLLGAGMPFMFVTLTTASLSTVGREDYTDASALYTLMRTVGGNIGYALMATLVADYSQIHRSQLVGHINAYNPLVRATHDMITGGLVNAGFTTPDASIRAYAALNYTVQRQAEMLAYNSSSLWMGFLVLATVPIVFLLPKAAHSEGPMAAE